jgi:phage gp29-like protein
LLREGLQGVERWSQGIVVGTLDEDRAGEPDTQTTENEKTAMLTALTNMRSRHVYVQGKQDDIKVVTGGGEGHQMVMGMIDYVDDCIMAVCTGAVLMSSKSNAGDAGSHARDEVGQNTQNKIVASDQKKIDEDISTWAVSLWVRQNWKLICKYGLQDARLPQVKTVQPESNDPDKFATRLAAVWGAQPKFKVRTDEVYEKLGLTPVNDKEDEFIQGADQSGSQGADPNDPSAMMQEGATGQVQPSQPSPAAAMRATMTERQRRRTE